MGRFKNMKSRKFNVLILLVLFIFQSDVFAQNCDHHLNFEGTVRMADLIIVGNKVTDPQILTESDAYIDTDLILVEVKRILKGEEKNKYIKILRNFGLPQGWGIDLGEKTYLIFLTRIDAAKGVEYRAVEQGCSVRMYLMEGDIVVFSDKMVHIDDFALRITTILENVPENKLLVEGA